MPPTSNKKKRQQLAMANARATRHGAAADKENLDPARVSTRKQRAARAAGREPSQHELKQEIGRLEAKLAAKSQALDCSEKRANDAERRANSNARLARKWLERYRHWHTVAQPLLALPGKLAGMTSHRDRLRKELRAHQKRVARAKGIKDRSVSKALAALMKERRILHLKRRGRIMPHVRRMLRRLVSSAQVPVAKAALVIKIVAEGVGMEVEGKICRKSIAAAVIEGGIAAELQIVDAMRTATCTCHSRTPSHCILNPLQRAVSAWMGRFIDIEI